MLNSLGFGGSGNTFPTDLEVFITAAVLVAIAAVLVAGRRASDPRGLRPAARYLSAICVLTLFVSLYAAFGTVQALTDLVVDHTARLKETKAEANAQNDFTDFTGGVFLPVGTVIFDFSGEPNNDSNYAAAMASGLVALTTGGIFFFHARWRRRLAGSATEPGDAVERVDRAYHYGVCFVAAITVAVGAASAAFGIFEVVAPGVAIGGNAKVVRAEGIAELAAFGTLALVSALVFRSSWRRAGRPDFAALRNAIDAPTDDAGTPDAAVLEPVGAPEPENGAAPERRRSSRTQGAVTSTRMRRRAAVARSSSRRTVATRTRDDRHQLATASGARRTHELCFLVEGQERRTGASHPVARRGRRPAPAPSRRPRGPTRCARG